jgi:uncharacterized protein
MNQNWSCRAFAGLGSQQRNSMDSHDPVSIALVQAIRTGDLASLAMLLGEHPGLASERIDEGSGKSRTPLHETADWPGYFPGGPAVVRALIEAGADPSAPVLGASHTETPLHWAASSDDADVAAELLDGGADIEAPGGSIGTPLDNAVGYGCWHVARLLAGRGARVNGLWQAAALGLMPLVEEFLACVPPPPPEELDQAFWQACHGGQRRVAEYLLGCGADLNGHPGYSDQTPADVAAALDTRRENLVTWLSERGARSAQEAAQLR